MRFSRLWLTGLLMLPMLGSAQSLRLQAIWETDTTLRTPESVLFDASRQQLYVSCVNGEPTRQNQRSFIATVDLDGTVRQLKFVDSLNATKGMSLLNERLYVTELTQVVEIALPTGTILNRYPIEGAVFLNDLAVDTLTRTLYVTDSKAGKLWALHNGKATLLLSGERLKGANGIRMDGHRVLIGNEVGSLVGFNPVTGQLETIAKVVGSTSLDGIVRLADGTFLLNEVGGTIRHRLKNGRIEVLLDTKAQGIQSADSDYDPATRTLFVPTLNNNTVRAYRIQAARP